MHKTCDSLAYLWYSRREQCVKCVEIDTKVLKLWSTVFHKFFDEHFEQDHHSLQMADHFTPHREHCSPIFEHSTPLSYSSFTHYISAINRSRGIINSRRQEQTIGDQLWVMWRSPPLLH
jgi:hypothetical protein